MESVQQMLTSGSQVANSASSVAHALAKPRTAASSSTSGASTSGNAGAPASSSTITANDFLTLLVAEMKNQDPTQPTDPNQYISQMVDVNSLQQLIGINQGVTSLDSAAGASTNGSTGSATSAVGTAD